MNEELTPRQLKILKTIIEENIQSGEAVGSEMLDKKYNLGVSPATIRNEMAQLEKKGFLHKAHISGGRLPTTAALRFYLKQLMEEKQLSVADEVAVKEKIWDARTKIEKLLSQTTQVLAQKTDALAVALTSEGDLYHAGYANILDLPEFFDIDVTKTVLGLIEDFSAIHKVFAKAAEEESVHVLLGEDWGLEVLNSCALVFTDFQASSLKGSLGVIGSCRFNFAYVIPTVRYFGTLLNDILKEW